MQTDDFEFFMPTHVDGNGSVLAHRFPADEPIASSDFPEWIDESLFWYDGGMRMAMRNDGSLVILTKNDPITADPGDWVVWRRKREGEEFEVLNNHDFERQFAPI